MEGLLEKAGHSDAKGKGVGGFRAHISHPPHLFAGPSAESVLDSDFARHSSQGVLDPKKKVPGPLSETCEKESSNGIFEMVSPIMKVGGSPQNPIINLLWF